MLGVEAAVPVDLCVIEAEAAVLLVDFDVQVRVAGEELVAEGAVGVSVADPVGLVDDGADGGVLVEEDGGDEVFVGEVLVAEVQVGWRVVSGRLVCRCWFLKDGTDVPTWPMMLNPEGTSSCSASGSIALMISSDFSSVILFNTILVSCTYIQ